MSLMYSKKIKETILLENVVRSILGEGTDHVSFLLFPQLY